jgi:hypothetical protein
MKFPALLRRYHLLLPTLFGWLLILLAGGLLAIFVARNLALFLIVDEPLGADNLVIEAWMSRDELDQALDYFEANDYQRAILVGGPVKDFHGIDTNLAERAGTYLRGQGLSVAQSVVIQAPYSAQNRTFLNAVLVREWFAGQGIAVDRVDVFTASVHTRRSQYLYQLAFGDAVEVGVIPSRPPDFDPVRWWRTSQWGKHVAVEFAGWVMVKCCFYPGEPGSHLEMWGIEKATE